MNKRFSSKFKTSIVTIFPGECYTSNKNEVISTVLGSCIAVCLYDINNNIGGMNHFMLPEGSDGKLDMKNLDNRAMRFGMTAMEVLIAMMMKKGADRKNLKAKIFGGGNVLYSMLNSPTVGEKNVQFIRSYLKSENIPIENENVNGNIGRKIFFLTGTKSIFMKEIPINKVESSNIKYRKSLEAKKEQEDITIF